MILLLVAGMLLFLILDTVMLMKTLYMITVRCALAWNGGVESYSIENSDAWYRTKHCCAALTIRWFAVRWIAMRWFAIRWFAIRWFAIRWFAIWCSSV